MALGSGKSHSIRRIVRIRQMLQQWRKKARMTPCPHAPSDVPSGHVAVCVGSRSRRFIVRATHLNHPIFQKLLHQAAEEYGFSNQGPLLIPCEESVFEEILQVVGRSEFSTSGRFLNVDNPQIRHCRVGESRPLLGEFPGESVC